MAKKVNYNTGNLLKRPVRVSIDPGDMDEICENIHDRKEEVKKPKPKRITIDLEPGLYESLHRATTKQLISKRQYVVRLLQSSLNYK